MCFSASASYTASALLLLSGIIALSKAKHRQRMLAAIPLLFAIQQFIEGTTWQALYAGAPATISTYAYLVFVFLVWPLWIPLSIRMISTTKREHLLLKLPLAAGSFVAVLSLVFAFYLTPYAAITCNSIRYIADLPSYVWQTGTIAYLIATIPPFFIIRKKGFWLMGTALAIAYLVSFVFYYTTSLSMWCFFAALLSIFTLSIVW